MEDHRIRRRALTAREAGLVSCLSCGRLHPLRTPVCDQCGAHLASRKPQSLQRVWAWLIAGFITYIPANVYPIMITHTLSNDYANTIIGGAVLLYREGSWAIASVIMAASVLIPIFKMMSIMFLAASISWRWRWRPIERLHLYKIVEFIGRWSMVDVFVVVILASLVQLGAIASIEPGPAAAIFALSVVLTMFAAQAIDPRMIWDNAEQEETT